MSPRLAAAAAAVGVGAMVLVGCGGGGDDGPTAGDFEGEWTVSLVVGAADTDEGADADSTLGYAGTTFRERWVFEGCDAERCSLRRPEGGFLLGDLDEVPFTFVTAGELDDVRRFVGEGVGEAVARPEEPEPDEPGDVDEAEDPDAACVGTAAQRWSVRIELSVVDRVLSGTALRRPEARQVRVGDSTCFGVDLTLGFSGVPAAIGAEGTSG